MKVFLDTNVLTSALATRGLCHELFIVVISDHQLISSNTVLTELQRVLTTKLKIPEVTTAGFVRMISETAQIIDSQTQLDGIPDPNDAPILAAAIEAKSSYFVTGDKALLKLKAISDLPIVSPREFWQALSNVPD